MLRDAKVMVSLRLENISRTMIVMTLVFTTRMVTMTVAEVVVDDACFYR